MKNIFQFLSLLLFLGFSKTSVAATFTNYDFGKVCSIQKIVPAIKSGIICLPESGIVSLKDLHIEKMPVGNISLMWFTSKDHSMDKFIGDFNTVRAGTYYAFYYDRDNKCFSKPSEAVFVEECKTEGSFSIKEVTPLEKSDVLETSNFVATGNYDTSRKNCFLASYESTMQAIAFYTDYYTKEINLYDYLVDVTTNKPRPARTHIVFTKAVPEEIEGQMGYNPRNAVPDPAHVKKGLYRVYIVSDSDPSCASRTGLPFKVQDSDDGGGEPGGPTCSNSNLKPKVNSSPICLPESGTINLNDQLIEQVPNGQTVKWYTSTVHTPNFLVTNPLAVKEGYYYAYYYNLINNTECFSKHSDIVLVNKCKSDCSIKDMVPDIQSGKVCLPESGGVNLYSLGKFIDGASLLWFYSPSHTWDNLVENANNVGEGTYYAFYYNENNGKECFSYTTSPVIVEKCGLDCGIKDLIPDVQSGQICLPETGGVNLNKLGKAPEGAQLLWYTSPDHSINNVITKPLAVGEGTYYAFYYIDNNGKECFSKPSEAVVIKKCYCVNKPNISTGGELSIVGLSTRELVDNWSKDVPNAMLFLDSKNKGFVIPRIDPLSIKDSDLVEGMLIYDIQSECVKLYNGSSWHCVKRSCDKI